MAIYRSSQVPSFKYENTESLTKLTKPKIFAAKMHEPKNKREDLNKKPKKDSAPDMGSYEAVKSYEFL